LTKYKGVFTRPDASSVAQPTTSKHRKIKKLQTVLNKNNQSISKTFYIALSVESESEMHGKESSTRLSVHVYCRQCQINKWI